MGRGNDRYFSVVGNYVRRRGTPACAWTSSRYEMPPAKRAGQGSVIHARITSPVPVTLVALSLYVEAIGGGLPEYDVRGRSGTLRHRIERDRRAGVFSACLSIPIALH